MTLFMISLAGIPGTAGFIGKFSLFGAAVQGGHVPLTIIAVLGSLISVYYYLRLPVMMYMREPADDAPPRVSTDTLEGFVLVLCACAVVFLGLFPNALPGPLSGLRVLEWAKLSVAGLM
jgi:NADH-quinone oxidoreductase subunit N